MKLLDMLNGVTYQCIQGQPEQEIIALTTDSRKVEKGCVFVCIKGAVYDGHRYIADVAAKGAAAVVVEQDVAEEVRDIDVTVIWVENTHYACAFMAAAWFGHPAEKLTVIGITGTKGKTTTTYMVKAVLEHAGIPCGLIGTIESIIGNKAIPAKNTTPDSYTLQETFAEMVEAGEKAVVMEVSSQALMQHRTQGFVFDIGVFTNLEPDHIGPNEHASFEEYMACKGLLFKQCKVGIVNGDDAHVNRVIAGHTCEIETFGTGDGNMLRADNIEHIHVPGALGMAFHAKGLMNMEVEVSSPGMFSIYNTLCAMAICRRFDVKEQDLKEALLSVKVKGRIEKVDISPDFTLLIDYAHNAMALESLLTTLRQYHPTRLVCLFGCGGNRSKIRRYEMGEVSGKLADFTIITSDNPRDEKPEDIIEDIKVGMAKTDGRYIEICDRVEAIAYAISHAKKGDIIVLAGKGHEDYQEIKGVKYPMDEREIIRKLLAQGLEPGTSK